MRLLIVAASLALAVPALAARADTPVTRGPSIGRRFYARVIQSGKLEDGALVDETDVPTDRKYRVIGKGQGVAALDSSWCVAHFSALGLHGGDETQPERVIDRGCTGHMATTRFDWAGQVPSPMNQSRLDELYGRLYRRMFGK